MLVTGHTGFKGSWLTLWLTKLGARVTGYALAPAGQSVFAHARLEEVCESLEGDVRDRAALRDAFRRAQPEIVFHLAAQAIVREGFERPIEAFDTNVRGTVNLLEELRERGGPLAAVIVTSDKCYRRLPRDLPHREDDPLGGNDPYSASKAACEIAVEAYRKSYFSPMNLADHGVAVATVRAGNVVGGGDWGAHRLVPDVIRALSSSEPVPIRNPDHVRPWQHVADVLSGYLGLGARLIEAAHGVRGRDFACGAWNFAPPLGRDWSVRELVESCLEHWGGGTWVRQADPSGPVERDTLRLDASKAETLLSWRPRWLHEEMVSRTVHWYRASAEGMRGAALRDLTLAQLGEHARLSDS